MILKKLIPAAFFIFLYVFYISSAHALPAVSKDGIVVSAHPLATEIGVEVLRQGGNAIDAAVATAFALGVVEPYASGIGGGGFMLIYLKERDENVAVDYRERAPLRAKDNMYLKKGEPNRDLSLNGHLSVAVPGTVAGLSLALQKYGTISLKEALAPAIKLAEEGVYVNLLLRQKTASRKDILSKYKATSGVFLPNGEVPEIGDKLVQQDLAKTLISITERGSSVFYEGWIAEAIEGEMKQGGGIITKEDLRRYKPRILKPVVGTYRGYKVVSIPPPSSGGVAIIEILNILEDYELKLDPFSSSSVHLMVEAMKRAFADRFYFLGDPHFVEMPIKWLVSKGYAKEIRKTISLTRAAPSEEVIHGEPWAHEGESTTHISVVDRFGNAVSLTQSINYFFGSGVVVPGTGILLNDEMDDFNLTPNSPNSIAPAKTPLSSMSPTLVFKDGKIFMIVGSPGGIRIINILLQVLLNVIDFDMDLEKAVFAPRFSHHLLSKAVQAERYCLSEDVKKRLQDMGHKIKEVNDFGNVQAVLIDEKTGLKFGVSDRRGIGEAIGE